jgi:hypothetical protein
LIVPLGSGVWMAPFWKVHARGPWPAAGGPPRGSRQLSPTSDDAAQHAAGGHDLVAFLERLSIALVSLARLHLRTDHQEVQHHEHQHDRQEAEQLLLGRRCGALRVSV